MRFFILDIRIRCSFLIWKLANLKPKCIIKNKFKAKMSFNAKQLANATLKKLSLQFWNRMMFFANKHIHRFDEQNWNATAKFGLDRRIGSILKWYLGYKSHFASLSMEAQAESKMVSVFNCIGFFSWIKCILLPNRMASQVMRFFYCWTEMSHHFISFFKFFWIELRCSEHKL